MKTHCIACEESYSFLTSGRYYFRSVQFTFPEIHARTVFALSEGDTLETGCSDVWRHFSSVVLLKSSQINEEFRQLTTKTLEPKFMALLDSYTPRLLGLFQSK